MTFTGTDEDDVIIDSAHDDSLTVARMRIISAVNGTTVIFLRRLETTTSTEGTAMTSRLAAMVKTSFGETAATIPWQENSLTIRCWQERITTIVRAIIARM
ncbi:MAG: hypothetical protein VKO39_07105 [Cyanobacteriota bacterium]|nr:hypothetical protein [Cyanobacteriota bacterium]